jgi:hypothetical protein
VGQLAKPRFGGALAKDGVSGETGGGVSSIVPGSGIDVDNTDPENPILSAVPWVLAVPVVVVPADIQNVNVAGLNGNADGEYWIQVKWRKNGTGAAGCRMRPNNDTVNPSSAGWLTRTDGTNGSYAALTYWAIGEYTGTGATDFGEINIFFDPTIVPANASRTGNYNSRGFRAINNGSDSFHGHVFWANQIANLTNLEVYSNGPNGVGAGTTITVRKRG